MLLFKTVHILYNVNSVNRVFHISFKNYLYVYVHFVYINFSGHTFTQSKYFALAVLKTTFCSESTCTVIFYTANFMFLDTIL